MSRLDRPILIVLMLLLGIGLVQVYSASFIFAMDSYQDSLHFFRRQCFFVFLAIPVLLIFANIDWSYYERFGHFLWIISLLLVALTFVPGLGVKVGGAQRWIQLPFGFRFEPVELLKISAPLFFMRFLHWDQDLKSRLIGLSLMVLPLVLLLFQPDFGSLVIISFVFFMLFFIFGLHLKYLAGAVVLSIPTFYFLVMSVPYRKARVLAFLDPWADPGQKGFQVIQSMLGMHKGGFFGVGLGQSQAKLFFLPEAHTDFTLAIWGEETGFIGVIFLLSLYGYLVFRGFQMAFRSQQPEVKATALGLTLLLAVSVFVNFGVVTGILPAKGLTLPFMSYGGSSLLCLSLAMAILLSLARHVDESINSAPKWQQFTFRGGR